MTMKIYWKSWRSFSSFFNPNFHCPTTILATCMSSVQALSCGRLWQWASCLGAPGAGWLGACRTTRVSPAAALCSPPPPPRHESVWRSKCVPLHGLQRWVGVLLHSLMWSQLCLPSQQGCICPCNILIQYDTSWSKEKPKMEESKAISFSAFPLKILSKSNTFLWTLSIFDRLALSVDHFAINVTQSLQEASPASYHQHTKSLILHFNWPQEQSPSLL